MSVFRKNLVLKAMSSSVGALTPAEVATAAGVVPLRWYSSVDRDEHVGSAEQDVEDMLYELCAEGCVEQLKDGTPWGKPRFRYVQTREQARAECIAKIMKLESDLDEEEFATNETLLLLYDKAS